MKSRDDLQIINFLNSHADNGLRGQYYGFIRSYWGRTVVLAYFEWMKSPRWMGMAILIKRVKIRSPKAQMPKEINISVIFGIYS